MKNISIFRETVGWTYKEIFTLKPMMKVVLSFVDGILKMLQWYRMNLGKGIQVEFNLKNWLFSNQRKKSKSTYVCSKCDVPLSPIPYWINLKMKMSWLLAFWVVNLPPHVIVGTNTTFHHSTDLLGGRYKNNRMLLTILKETQMKAKGSPSWGSNPGPSGSKPTALPTEPHGRSYKLIRIDRYSTYKTKMCGGGCLTSSFLGFLWGEVASVLIETSWMLKMSTEEHIFKLVWTRNKRNA